jgi:hypothetical protein
VFLFQEFMVSGAFLYLPMESFDDCFGDRGSIE